MAVGRGCGQMSLVKKKFNKKIKSEANFKKIEKMLNIYETKTSDSLIALFTAFSSSSSGYFLGHVGPFHNITV